MSQLYGLKAEAVGLRISIARGRSTKSPIPYAYCGGGSVFASIAFIRATSVLIWSLQVRRSNLPSRAAARHEAENSLRHRTAHRFRCRGLRQTFKMGHFCFLCGQLSFQPLSRHFSGVRLHESRAGTIKGRYRARPAPM